MRRELVVCKILDILAGVAIATPVSVLLYVSIESTKFEFWAEPLAVTSWVGLVWTVVKQRNGDA